MKHRSLAAIYTLIILAVLGSTAKSQWREIVPHMLRLSGTPAGASMTYKDGVLWAGYHSLMVSRDSGLTWSGVTPFFDPKADWIVNIQFLDRNTGVVATFEGAFLTTNGGSTWRDVTSAFKIPFNPGSTALLLGSTDTIILGLSTPGAIYRSTDRGTSWSEQQLDQLGRSLIKHGSAAYYLASQATDQPDAGGMLYTSTDAGLHWNPTGGLFDEDCYSYAFDSCNTTIYMVNEAAAKSFDTASRLLTSSDNGASWISPLTEEPGFLSGAIALGRQSVYVTTVDHGVLRSTDQGNTWKQIGGPASAQYDANCISAISDNTLVAFDADGSIWRTTNSGGDSVINLYSPATLQAAQLFDSVTVAPCREALGTVKINPYTGKNCNAPSITSVQVTGADSAFYTLLSSPSGDLRALDSAVIAFEPRAGRIHSATLRITFSNGDVWNVALGGRGSDSTLVTVTAQDVITDTIGGDQTLRFALVGAHPQMDLSLSFDTVALKYGRTLGEGGVPITESRQADGSVILHIQGAGGLGTDTAYYLTSFSLYPTSDTCFMVELGPGVFPSDSTCGRVIGTNAKLCYTGPVCALPFIDPLLSDGTSPIFAIRPDPASNTATISSNVAIKDAEVTIQNNLGQTEVALRSDLGPSGKSIDVSGLEPGLKIVTITRGAFMQRRRLIVTH